jgi:hypothetical protein
MGSRLAKISGDIYEGEVSGGVIHNISRGLTIKSKSTTGVDCVEAGASPVVTLTDDVSAA